MVEHLDRMLETPGCTNSATVITRVMVMKEVKERLNYSRQVACRASRDDVSVSLSKSPVSGAIQLSSLLCFRGH